MRLHIFNPSHDEALSADSAYYYPTAAARTLERTLAALPAVMAETGDCVYLPQGAVGITDTSSSAEGAAWRRGVCLVRNDSLTPAFWDKVTEIAPWGWDKLLRHCLRRTGCPERLLPSDAQLAETRRLSSRETAVLLLPRLRRKTGFASVGENTLCCTADEVRKKVGLWGGLMAKSLWSCSGRGVYRLGTESKESAWNRTARLLREQGAVECEPFYNARLNFAMEFTALSGGGVTYDGLSLFRASAAGAYGGNVVATQEQLENIIAPACGLSAVMLHDLAHTLCGELTYLLDGRYTGPLGIDMMAVETEDGGTALHPCVEVNLRRTMGHVALAIAAKMANADALPEALGKMWYFCP